MNGEAGKGDKPRAVDGKKYRACPMWANREARKVKTKKDEGKSNRDK